MTSPGDDLAEALAFLAEHRGLVRWHDDDEDGAFAWAMVRVPWSPEDRIVSRIVMDDLDEPVAVALVAIEEVRAELAAREARRVLRLAPAVGAT